MSEQQIANDIERTRQRIERLRKRFASHVQSLEAAPSQAAATAWNTLGQSVLSFRGGAMTGSKQHWVRGLVSAGAAWYLSQPGNFRKLWRFIYPYLRQKRKKTEQPTSTPAND